MEVLTLRKHNVNNVKALKVMEVLDKYRFGFFFSNRYIYVSDILDHEVDVFERLDGEQLVYIKVCVFVFLNLGSDKDGSAF